MTGSAAAYDVRYSASAITAANFASATPLSAPAPLAGGQVQGVQAYLPAGTWHFALKTRDEVPNWSTVSNDAPATVTGAVSLPSGAKLWLRSDAGVTLNGSTVAAWADQS